MKSLKVEDEVWSRLNKGRKTEQGTVSFNDYIKWLLDQADKK